MMRPCYDTDLTDEQWLKISSFYPEANRRGRPRTQDFREITNAILYLVRAGCAWRLLPHDFPKWQTVYYYFRRWQKEGVWPKIHDAVRAEVRVSLQEGMSSPLLQSPIPNRFVQGIMDYPRVLMVES